MSIVKKTVTIQYCSRGKTAGRQKLAILEAYDGFGEMFSLAHLYGTIYIYFVQRLR